MINIYYFKHNEQATSHQLVYATSVFLAVNSILNTVCFEAVINTVFRNELHSCLLSLDSNCLLFPSVD